MDVRVYSQLVRNAWLFYYVNVQRFIQLERILGCASTMTLEHTLSQFLRARGQDLEVRKFVLLWNQSIVPSHQ